MEQYNILCCPDNNYIPYCGIMLTSLFENNRDINFTVYIIAAKLKKTNKELLEKLCCIYNNCISFIDIENNDLGNCPVRQGDHVSIAAYYRIFAPQLLPQNIDKILYLDGDIIINGSINNLYNTNIDNYAFGAVIDEDYLGEKKYTRLEIPFNKSYINSGVLLINLKYWREYNLVDQCLVYTKNNQEKIVLHDQDVLNAVLFDKIKLLPITYNFQTGFLYKITKLDNDKRIELQNCLYTPIIIHYTGPCKPWHKDCKHPYRKRFIYNKSISLWNKQPMIGNKNTKDFIIGLISEIVRKIGIKKKTQTYIIRAQK